MTKKDKNVFTWFKFDPTTWLIGNISNQPENIQINFLRICCKYWTVKCQMPVKDAILYCGKNVYSTLIEFEFIKDDNGFIKIDFLDNQWNDIEELKIKRSKAGKESANVRYKIEHVLEKNEHVFNKCSTSDTEKSIVLEKNVTHVQQIRDIENNIIDFNKLKSIVDKPSADTTKKTSLKERTEKFIELFNEAKYGKDYKGRKHQYSKAIEGKLNARLKDGYEPRQILLALSNAMKQSYHIENNFRYITPEFILRTDKIEMYGVGKPKQQK